MKIYYMNIQIILLNQIELFKPDKVCLGGGFVKISESIIYDMIKTKYKNSKIFSTMFDYDRPKLIIAQKLNCSEIIGIILLLEDKFKNL